MTPGAKMNDEMAKRVEHICSRFRAHLAAEFDFVSKTPRGERRVTITLIPEFLIKDAGEHTGLLIVAKGQGSLTWNGEAVLSPFALVTAGFRPMDMAAELALLLNTVVGTARALIEARPAKDPLYLGHDGEKSDDSPAKRRSRKNPRNHHGKGGRTAPGVPKRRSRKAEVGEGTKPV